MIDFNEAMKLTDIAEIDKEIEERRDLLERMVGNLYPPLLRGQVIDLRMRKEELEKRK
jgi:hypothetical protein